MGAAEAIEADRRRLRRRLSAAQHVDFFHADGRESAPLFDTLYASLGGQAAATATSAETLQEL